MAESSAQQSVKVEEAAWISGRLSPFDSCVVTSVVPHGFEAYTCVLHPLDPPARGQQPGRWADVASWCATELTPGIDFPDIVLPEHGPSGVEPWPGQVPQVGTLHPADAEALAAVLARHTSTPDRCWFCPGRAAFAADGAACTLSSADRSVRWVPAGKGSTDQRDATIGALEFWTHVRMIVQQHARR